MKKIFQPTQCLSREELEHYAKGDVSEDLRYKIENHLVDCPFCSEAMEGYQVIEEDSNVVFDELYRDIDARLSTDAAPLSSKMIPWNRIAAGILFLFTAGAAYFFYQSNAGTYEYMAYFETQDNTLATRGVDASILSTELKAGYNLYANKNYQGSLSFFEDYLKSNPESTMASYYAGMSALNVGEKESALDFLMTVRMNDDQLYEEATWRLAGIHLERGAEEKARAFLTDLTKVENGFFVEKAKELLEKLK